MTTDPTVTDPTATDAHRLAPLAAFLRRMASTRWQVEYGEAEALSGRLAQRLREVLSPEEMAVAEWRGIPRGGLIVLGMLAYHLDLPRHRLPGGSGPGGRPDPTVDPRLPPEREAGSGGPRGAAGASALPDPDSDAVAASDSRPAPLAAPPAAPLVLVDDCALSGLRLRQTLEALAAEPGGAERTVVVAHLLSAPALRRAVVEGEPRVRACLAGADLADLSETLYPDPEARRVWRRRWAERLATDRRYWLGMPRMVSFPWGEPDRPFWNDATERVEDGWRFVPPHRCLKNRTALARELPPTPVAGPFWQLADEVAWGDFPPVLWLCQTATQQVYSLEGTARLAWKALVTGRGTEGAAEVLAVAYDVAREQARQDVAALVQDLRRCGILVPSDPALAELPSRLEGTGEGHARDESPAESAVQDPRPAAPPEESGPGPSNSSGRGDAPSRDPADGGTGHGS